MATFNGQLRSNEIFAALYNMIISQQVFSDNIKGTASKLVDMSRVDGSLYGDTKLYYATDCLESKKWGADAEAGNLLDLHRPNAPAVQAIYLDTFRQISLTVDNYLSKRAWATEGAFSDFTSVMLGWIRDTKRVYDSTIFNAYVGTAETSVGKQTITVTVPAAGDTPTEVEASNRITAQTVAAKIADILVELEDVSRDYNDYGYLRSYDKSDLIIVWNSEWLNAIKKLDLPTIFHGENIIEKFGEYSLPARYFGTVNTSGATTGAANISVRSLVETDYDDTHVFAGDLLPNSTEYPATLENKPCTYTGNDNVICKIMHKRSVPFMSAFEVGTSFFNPKSLTENHYLTFGHNTLEYLKNYPFITIKAVEA